MAKCVLPDQLKYRNVVQQKNWCARFLVKNTGVLWCREGLLRNCMDLALLTTGKERPIADDESRK